MCQLSTNRAFWVFCRERFYLNCYHDYRGQRAALGVMAINPISNSLSLLPQAPFSPNTQKIIPHSGTCKSRGLHDIMPTRHKDFLYGERTGMIHVRLATVETSTEGGGRCWGEWCGGPGHTLFCFLMFCLKQKCVLACEIGKWGKIQGPLESFSRIKPLVMNEDTGCWEQGRLGHPAPTRRPGVGLALGPSIPPLWPWVCR